MNKVLAFVRLDLITIKPYLTIKNLLVFIIFSLLLTFSMDTNTSAIGFLMMYGTIYVSYPFAVGEQNGIDALYVSLSIKRKTVVLGRYLFALFMDICAGVLSYIFTFLITIVMNKSFDSLETLVVIFVMFILYSVIQAIQLPIFFKLGYANAKFLSFLPFIGLSICILLFVTYMNNIPFIVNILYFFTWILSNTILAILLGIGVWLLILFISYKLSCKFYQERNF